MDLTVRINENFSLLGQLPASGEGFIISPDGFEGWDDAVSIKGEAISRPQGHGDFDVPGFLDSRIVSLSGACLAESAPRLRRLGSTFRGVLATGAGRVTVTHMGETKWGIARLAPGTQAKFKVNGADSRSAAFQLQLKFANPRLFGDSRTFSSGVPAYHYGNFPATPTHVVRGSRTGGYTVSGPGGKKFIVTASIGWDAPHTITESGSLFINGVQVFGAVTQADTWTVPVGVEVVQSVTAGLFLDTTVADTFL
jgi:hypothetical protein